MIPRSRTPASSLLITIVFLVFVGASIIVWFNFPEQRETSGALFTYVALVISVFQPILKFLIDHGIVPEIRLNAKALKKAGRTSLMISAIAVISGGVYFLSSLESVSLRGKKVASEGFLSNYGSMYMGDTGDIEFLKLPDKIMEFIYKTNGRGPHQWEYKYIGGEENRNPAKFAGIMLADSAWGINANDGYDLREYKEIRWKACIKEGSDLNNDGNIVIEFVAGGITWQINDALKKNVLVPFPDSLPKQTLGIYTLKKCPDMEVMSFSLFSMPDESLQKVIGGFGWVVSWAPNDVVANSNGTAPEKAKTFRISISEVQYIKDNSLKALLGRNLEALLSIALVIFIISVIATIKATAPQKDEATRQ